MIHNPIAEGLFNSSYKILIGSYTGNGNYGPNQPTTISIDGVPKFLMVSPQNDNMLTSGDYGITSGFVWFEGTTTMQIGRYRINNEGTYNFSLHFQTNNNLISWYGETIGGDYPENYKCQYNDNGVIYSYFLIYQ